MLEYRVATVYKSETNSSHCVVSFSDTPYLLLSTGSIQEDWELSRHDWKIDDKDVKHQHKQTTVSWVKGLFLNSGF